MKILMGLIILSASVPSFADSTNGSLLLRARVPASSRIVIGWNKNQPTSKIVSNSQNTNGSPKITIEKKTEHYLVSVTHP